MAVQLPECKQKSAPRQGQVASFSEVLLCMHKWETAFLERTRQGYGHRSGGHCRDELFENICRRLLVREPSEYVHRVLSNDVKEYLIGRVGLRMFHDDIHIEVFPAQADSDILVDGQFLRVRKVQNTEVVPEEGATAGS